MESERSRVLLVETQLPSSPVAPSTARAFLRTALNTCALDGFGDVTELLADELVTNVVKHVGSPLTLRARYQPGRIRIEVDDPSIDPPVLREPDATATGGRGIQLVARLSTDWGTQIRKFGKTVWFEIDVDTATTEIHPSRDGRFHAADDTTGEPI